MFTTAASIRTMSLVAFSIVAAACGDATSDPESPMRGAVYALQIGSTAYAGARIADSSELDARLDCEQRIEAPCRITTCTRIGDGALPAPREVWPGDIAVRGEMECTIVPTADGTDRSCTLPAGERFWDPSTGGPVAFVAPGGDVPGFTVELDGSSTPTVVAPIAPSVPVTSDLEIRWTGGSGTMRVFGGGWSATSDASVIVSCEAPAGADSVVVPRAVLEALMPGHPIIAQTENREIRELGGYTTTFSAASFVAQWYIDR